MISRTVASSWPPGSVPGFVGAQVVGAAVAVGLVVWLYPHVGESADDVVVPHDHHPRPGPDTAARSTR